MSEREDDLAQIDTAGTIHPLGRIAQKELRKRPGDFAVLPSPGAVVVMRRADEHGTWLAGEIARAGAIWDLIGTLGQGGWTGELVVVDAERQERAIFFEGGSVIGSNSTARKERLGEVLYHYGALTEEQIEMVVAATTPEVRFGEAAVALGFLARERLFEMLGKQTEDIVFAVMRVDRGSFYFVDGIDPARLLNRLNLPVTGLMMEGVRRMDEMSAFRARVPSSEAVPVRMKDGPISPEHEHFLVFQAIDSRRSIETICRTVGLGEFDVTRAVFHLMQMGLVAISGPRPTEPVGIVELFNRAMALVLRKVDEVGGGRDVREQLASFATASGVYDALFRQAGPMKDGTLDPHKIAENIDLLVGPEDGPKMLAQWLYEYATFAMFIAEPLLRAKRGVGRDVGPESQRQSAALSKQVAELLRPLAPE